MSHENGKPKLLRTGQDQLIGEMGEVCHAILFPDGQFDMIPRKLFFIMNHQEAVLYAYLISIAKMNNVQDSADGFMYRHHITIETDLNICRSSQTRILSNLKKKGFLDVEIIRGRRKIRLNYNAVCKAIRRIEKSKILDYRTSKHYRDRGSASAKALP